MSNQFSVQDHLARIMADIDQAQALIDESRSKFPNDDLFKKTLDNKQFELDIQRERVKLMQFIDKIIDS
jgi:hypothetical protein